MEAGREVKKGQEIGGREDRGRHKGWKEKGRLEARLGDSGRHGG